MKKTSRLISILSMLIISMFLFVSCGAAPKADNNASMAGSLVSAKSDGSKDLIIDYQVNLAADDANNHFNWKGNVRYMAAEDKFDAVTGASALGSTHLFMMYLYDVEGKEAMGSSVRGLFLFGVNGHSQIVGDKLIADKAADGVITIQYVHRGTAFRFKTDASGNLTFPNGSFESKKIGTPTEIESKYSSDGKASGVDYAKVWSSGDIAFAGASKEALYVWDGKLKVTLNGDILAIAGDLTAVAAK